jgi:hypothetical protein
MSQADARLRGRPGERLQGDLRGECTRADHTIHNGPAQEQSFPGRDADVPFYLTLVL